MTRCGCLGCEIGRMWWVALSSAERDAVVLSSGRCGGRRAEKGVAHWTTLYVWAWVAREYCALISN